MKTAIIMPVLNPDEKTTGFADELVAAGFEKIIVINDGSAPEYDRYFNQINEYPQVTLLTHEVNKGKGAALKTAFSYLAENEKDIDGAVTVDGDGQHTVKCIKGCLEKFEEHPDSVIIGGRNFNESNIPARSRIGNKLSAVFYRFAVGIKLNDTQTGLRVVPASCFEDFAVLKGDRYEYETNMLIAIANKKIPYYEVPIATIYIDDNASSHFNAVKDSLRIVGTVGRYLIKFIASSIGCWLLDLGLYALLAFLLADSGMPDSTQVLVCTVAARIVSSFTNFMVNRNGVFKSKDKSGGAVVRYYVLAVCQVAASYGLVYLFTFLFNATEAGQLAI
ncbi:MAG: glycosyltransferase family 2 protein, partial [Parasporobacterium sp.]|nr:glycosyltransferase family 2 protein [Parasporobacterium sp.]